MRYTAATCDPNNFRVSTSQMDDPLRFSDVSLQDEGYALRQAVFDPPRKTELFIVMTMYNVRSYINEFSIQCLF